MSNRKRDLNSYLISRSLCIFLPRLFYIPELSLIPRQVPDFTEQTRVSNGHPRCNSRIYPRVLPRLEKTHETFPSLRDEARFLCIACRAIAFSHGPFRLKHKTQGPSHVHIPKGKLLLRCLWKDDYLFIRRQGISSHLQMIWGARVFHPVALLKLMFL